MNVYALIDPPHHVYPTVTAASAAVVKAAAVDPDDDFTYEIVADPKGTGKAIIKVYDADGAYLGLF